MAVDRRTERIAHNESRFRENNERLERDLRTLPHGADERFTFVCECALRDCRELIELSFDEYEHVRRDSARFAVRPSHEIANVEDVVQRTDRYWVIAKHPAARPIVEATDPRRNP